MHKQVLYTCINVERDLRVRGRPHSQAYYTLLYMSSIIHLWHHSQNLPFYKTNSSLFYFLIFTVRLFTCWYVKWFDNHLLAFRGGCLCAGWPLSPWTTACIRPRVMCESQRQLICSASVTLTLTATGRVFQGRPSSQRLSHRSIMSVFGISIPKCKNISENFRFASFWCCKPETIGLVVHAHFLKYNL